jgi:hypothetical protein
MTTSVLAIPPALDGSMPYVLQTFKLRSEAISMAERLSERGWEVFVGSTPGELIAAHEKENGNG